MTSMKGYSPINFANLAPGSLDEAFAQRKSYVDAFVYKRYDNRYGSSEGEYNHVVRRKVLYASGHHLIASLPACKVLIREIESANIRMTKGYQKHKEMFELEQVLGRFELILNVPFFNPQKGSDADKIYSYEVYLYNQNIDESMKLARCLSGHPSSVMQYLGASLGLIGMLAMMSFILLTVVPSWSSFFSIELAQVGLSGLSTMVSQFLSISTTAANGTIGAAIVGGAISGTMALGGGYLSYKGKAQGLSKAMSDLSENARKYVNLSQIESVNDMDWFFYDNDNKIISKEDKALSLFLSSKQLSEKLEKVGFTTEMIGVLIKGLRLRIAQGFDKATILKEIECHLRLLDYQNYILSESDFFKISAICGVLVYNINHHDQVIANSGDYWKDESYVSMQKYNPFFKKVVPLFYEFDRPSGTLGQRPRVGFLLHPNPYDVLGVSAGCDEATLMSAYSNKVKERHSFHSTNCL